MKRMKPKKLLALFLAFVLTLSLLPSLAFAAEVSDEEGTVATCAITEGCTLEDGHEGECVTAQTEDDADDSIEENTKDKTGNEGDTTESIEPAETVESFSDIQTLTSDNEAVINGKEYPTLAEAFADVPENASATITLQKDASCGYIYIQDGKNITLDLGGNTLTGRIELYNGYLTIKNGTLKGTGGQMINMYGASTDTADYNSLTIAQDLSLIHI